MQDQQTNRKPVILSKSEERTISRLPGAMQAEARKELLAKKHAEREAYLNDPKTVARLERDALNRTQLSTRVTEKNVLCVYGIGRKFPVALYKSEWLKLIGYIETIKAEVAKIPDDVK